MTQVRYLDSNGNELKMVYQWDTDITLAVEGVSAPPLPVIQFYNRRSKAEETVVPTLSSGTLYVDVPNELLEHAEPIIAYVYRPASSGAARTIGEIFISVRPRIKPSNTVYAE